MGIIDNVNDLVYSFCVVFDNFKRFDVIRMDMVIVKIVFVNKRNLYFRVDFNVSVLIIIMF